MTSLPEDEVDLYEFFEAIWNGKGQIILSALLAALVGFIFLFVQKPEYEARLNFSIQNKPSFLSEGTVLAQFKKMFFSKGEFEYWKNNNVDTLLEYEDFSMTRVVDGFTITKDETELFAKFERPDEGGPLILVGTNELKILDDIYKYINYIDEKLRRSYFSLVTEEIKGLDEYLQKLEGTDSEIQKDLMSAKRFLVAIDSGASVISFQHPTMPAKVWPNSRIILLISVFVGGTIGVFIVLVRFAIRRHKSKLDQMQKGSKYKD